MREHLGQREEFLRALAYELNRSDVRNVRERLLRENILNTAFRLHQCKPESAGPILLPILNQQKIVLGEALADPEADEDLKEMLTEELEQVDMAIAAPSQPFARNFDQETEVETVHEKKKPIQGLALGK